MKRSPVNAISSFTGRPMVTIESGSIIRSPLLRSPVSLPTLALLAGASPRQARVLRRIPPLALLMGLSIGWSNLAYVLAILEGEVMRVLLLFYLAPLWTVPLARIVLGERLDRRGFIVMALAFAGAVT